MESSVFLIDFCVTGWQSTCLQTFLQNFRTTLAFSAKSVPFCVQLQGAPLPCVGILPDLDFEYLLAENSSVYFLLELSVCLLEDLPCKCSMRGRPLVQMQQFAKLVLLVAKLSATNCRSVPKLLGGIPTNCMHCFSLVS